MHKGQLRETGSHQELMRLGGIYWHLYQLQYAGNELPPAAPAAQANGLLGGHRG